MSAAEAYLDTIKAALDCKDPAKLAEKAQKLQSDLKDAELQVSTARLETTEAKGISSSHFARAERLEKELKESQETALALQQEVRDLDDLQSLTADNLGAAQTEAGEAQEALRKSQAALKLANASIESLRQGNEQLGREVDTLTDEVGRLTPRLSPWARIAFAGLGIFLIAYWSHRMGFDAAMALRGGAR